MGLLQRLKERKLVQWGIAYLCGAWVFVEATNLVVEQFSWPQIVGQVVTILAFFGFFVVLVLAWYHGEKGRQRVSGPELLMVAALLVVAGVALSTLGGGEEISQAVETTAPIEAEDTRPAIAVLPLEDLSPDPQNAFFARGVHTDITNALGRISSLAVKGRSSVEQYRQDRPTIREIASALAVDFLLEGTAEIVGTVVRVTVQLIDGQRDEYVWEDEWQAEYLPAEVIRIRTEIAEGVASNLRVAIAPEEERRIAAVPTEDPVAYKLVDRARYLWNLRSVPEVREAIELYEQAIERDSLYADAFAGLANAYLILGEYGGDYGQEWGEREESYRQATAMAARALELDPTLGIPHSVIALVRAHVDWDWDGADEEFLAALESNPDQAQIHAWYSGFLAGMGRTEDALRELSAAQRLDPLLPWLAHGAAYVYYMDRQYDRAIEAGIESITADPDNRGPYAWLCFTYLASGRMEEGMETCNEVDARWPVGRALAAVASAHRGEGEAALKELNDALATQGDQGLINWDAAVVHAVLGNLDEAFRWFRRHIAQNRNIVMLIPTDPILDPFRADPRWAEILEEIGFEG